MRALTRAIGRANDGGSYYLLPRDEHLLPKMNLPSKADLERLNRAYETERDAERKKAEPIAPELAALVDAFFRQLDQ
jgi:hypothetical protein